MYDLLEISMTVYVNRKRINVTKSYHVKGVSVQALVFAIHYTKCTTNINKEGATPENIPTRSGHSKVKKGQQWFRSSVTFFLFVCVCVRPFVSFQSLSPLVLLKPYI